MKSSFEQSILKTVDTGVSSTSTTLRVVSTQLEDCSSTVLRSANLGQIERIASGRTIKGWIEARNLHRAASKSGRDTTLRDSSGSPLMCHSRNGKSFSTGIEGTKMINHMSITIRGWIGLLFVPSPNVVCDVVCGRYCDRRNMFTYWQSPHDLYHMNDPIKTTVLPSTWKPPPKRESRPCRRRTKPRPATLESVVIGWIAYTCAVHGRRKPTREERVQLQELVRSEGEQSAENAIRDLCTSTRALSPQSSPETPPA
mgnify:CR=1 FL=1